MSEGANILDQELEDLARRLAQDIARANARKHEEQSRHLIFRSRAVRFRLPLEVVREVLLPLPLYRVPRAPEAVLGVMNHRGRVVTVLDWAMLLPWDFIPADQAEESLNQKMEDPWDSEGLGDSDDSQGTQDTLPRSEVQASPTRSFEVAMGFEGSGDFIAYKTSLSRIERPRGPHELSLLPTGREQDLRFILLDLFGNELGIKVDQVESISTQGNGRDSRGTEISEGYSIKPELLSEWIEALMA